MTDKSIETTIKELLVPHTTKQISIFQRLITLLERSENINYEEDIHQIISTFLENRNPELQISTLYILITCLKKGLFLSDKYMDIAFKVVNIAYNTDTKDVENQELCFKAYSALELIDNLHLKLFKSRTLEMAEILQKILTSGASSLQKLNALKMLNKLIQNTDFKTDKKLQNILLPLWFGQICPMMFNISQQNLQNSSLELSLNLLPLLQVILLEDNTYFNNFTVDLEKKYLPTMIDLVARENNLFAKLWIFLSKLLGATFAKRFAVVNMLLTVIEQAFKSTNIEIRMQAYHCWQSLIDSFLRNPDTFFTDKRIRLLTLPLKAHNGRIEQIVEIKFLTWCRLFDALHQKNIIFDQVPIFDLYLQFCFGPLKEQSLYSWLPQGINEIAQGKKFPSLHLNSSKTFLQLFGLKKYIDEELKSKLTLLKFEGPKLTLRGFSQNRKLLIDSVGECCVLLSQLQNSDRFECAAISEALWKSLFDSVDNLLDEVFKEKCIEQISALVIALAGVARKRSSLITFGLVPLFHIITSNEFKFFKHEKISELIFIPLITTVMKKDKILLQHDVVTIFKKIFMFKRNDENILPFIQTVLERFSLVKESIPADKIALLHNIWFSLEEELKHYLQIQKTINTNIDDKIYISSFCEFFIWPYMTLQQKFNQEKFTSKWTELYFLFRDNTSESLQIKLAIQIILNLRKLLPKSPNMVSVAQIIHFIISHLDFSTYSEEKKTDYVEIFTLIKPFLQSDSLKNDSIKFFMNSLQHIFTASKMYPYCLLEPVLDNLYYLLVLHKESQNREIMNSITNFLAHFQQNKQFFSNLEKLRDILIKASVDKNIIDPILEKSTSKENKIHKNVLKIEKPSCASDSEITVKKRGKKSLFRSKESPEISIKTPSPKNIDEAIDNMEKKQIVTLLGHDIETMSPVKLKGSLMPKKTNKSPQPTEINTPKTVNKEEIIVNTPYKFDPKKLTKNQREKLAKKRDDIPALYQDLSQSQTRDFGNSNSILESTQVLESQTKDQNKEKELEKCSNPFSELLNTDKVPDNQNTETTDVGTIETTKTPIKTAETPCKTSEKHKKVVKPLKIIDIKQKASEAKMKITDTLLMKLKKVAAEKQLKAEEKRLKAAASIDSHPKTIQLQSEIAETPTKTAETEPKTTEPNVNTIEANESQLETSATLLETAEPIKKKRGRKKSVKSLNKSLNISKRQSKRQKDSINERNVPILLENSENSKENLTESHSIVMRLSNDISSIDQDSNPLNTANIEINSSDLNSGNIENMPGETKAKRGRKRQNSLSKRINTRSSSFSLETDTDLDNSVHTANSIQRRRISLGSVKKPEETSPLWSDEGSASDLDEAKRRRVNRELQRIKMDIKNNEEYMKNNKRKTRMSGNLHSVPDSDNAKVSDDSKTPNSKGLIDKEDLHLKLSKPKNNPPDIPNQHKNILKIIECASLNVESPTTFVESENIIESSQQPEINIRPCKLPVLYPLEAVKPGELIAIGSGVSKTDIIKGPKPTSPFKILETFKIAPKSNTCKNIVFPSYTPENFDKIAKNFEKNAENLARKAENLTKTAENLSSSAENSAIPVQNEKNSLENSEVLVEITILQSNPCESIETSLKNFETFENNNSETESINSEVLAQIIPENLDILTVTPSKSNVEDFSCRKVLFNTNSTEDTEVPDMVVLSPIREQNSSIVTSPICSDTPTRNKELIKNTSELSPIKNLNFDDEVLIFGEKTTTDLSEKPCDHSENHSLVITPQEASTNVSKIDSVPENIVRDSPHPLKIRKKIPLKSIGGRSAQMMGMVSARTRILSPKRRKPKETVKTTETFLSPTHNRIIKMMNQLEKNTEEEKIIEEPEEQIREEDILRFTKQLPLPTDTPNGSILKKRKLSIDAEESPLRVCKRRRVNFHDPPVSNSKYIINPRKKSELDFPRITRSNSNTENNQNSTENILFTPEMLAEILPVSTEQVLEKTANDSVERTIEELEKVVNEDPVDLVEKSSNEVSVITKNSDSLFSDSLPSAQDFLQDKPGSSRSVAESVLHWSPSKSIQSSQEGQNEDEIKGGSFKDVMGSIIEGLQEKKFDVQPLLNLFLRKDLIKLILCQMSSDNLSQFMSQIFENVPFKTYIDPVPTESLPRKDPVNKSNDEQIQDVIKKLKNKEFSRDLQGTLLNTLVTSFSLIEIVELLGNEIKRKECNH